MTTPRLPRAVPGKERTFSEIKELWGWAVTPKDGHHCTWSPFIFGKVFMCRALFYVFSSRMMTL